MSSKKNREFMSAFGTATDAFQKLAQEVYARGGDDEALRLLISDEHVRNDVAKLLVEAQQPRMMANTYSVTVNWTRTLAQMVVAGRYDWVDDSINENNFPLSSPDQSGEPERSDCSDRYRTFNEVELKIIYLNQTRTISQVMAEHEAQGLRSATLPELLAFGERFPDFQRRFQVIALGSAWAGKSCHLTAPVLFGGLTYRNLGLHWLAPGYRWDRNIRLLAVRK